MHKASCKSLVKGQSSNCLFYDGFMVHTSIQYHLTQSTLELQQNYELISNIAWTDKSTVLKICKHAHFLNYT